MTRQVHEAAHSSKPATATFSFTGVTIVHSVVMIVSLS